MTTPANTRLVIADDHPLFRDALRQAVASVVASARIDEAGSFDDLTAMLEQDSDVDLILLDLTMPGISGFSGLIYLRAQYPAIPVVVVSASDDVGTIRRSLDFGASGFIPKRFGVETLRDAITRVMGGDVFVPPDTDLSAATDPDMTKLRDRLVTLTPQQVRVLMMLSEGLLNKQIAYELGVSEATIKAHVSAILQKLGVESRTQAVIAAAKIAGGQWKQATPTPKPYSAATICWVRHCPSTARSEAGFTGLFRMAMFSSRAAARTLGLRSAVIRVAGMFSPKRRRISRIAATPLPRSRW
jgi:DNA-binding NarL/FixJ family response regulator